MRRDSELEKGKRVGGCGGGAGSRISCVGVAQEGVRVVLKKNVTKVLKRVPRGY